MSSERENLVRPRISLRPASIELVKYTGDEHTVLTELEKGALFGEMAIIDNSARVPLLEQRLSAC